MSTSPGFADRARRLCAVSLLALAAFGCAQQSSFDDKGELVLVVAVFRHGVRAPLADFASHADEHAGRHWPATPADWGAKDWGDLTARGATLATRVGDYHGTHYTAVRPEGFKAYLWADVDSRTKDTANALASGMRRQPRIDVGVEWRASGPDPLFHPFKAACGKPDASELARISNMLDASRQGWVSQYAAELGQLDAVLACNKAQAETGCTPLSDVTDIAKPWIDGHERKEPVEWKGRFSYASSTTEAFLLEQANLMQVAWGRNPDIARLLRLHEFYFDKTDRDPYLARIGGSALLREISGQLNRKAGGAQGSCPRGDGSAWFVGLVGHDTNLANLNALLHVDWRLQGGADLAGFPANDALPAGALVFELYKRGNGNHVRIEYVALTPAQMHDDASGSPVRVPTTCDGTSPCDIALDAFNKLIFDAIGAGNPFLPSCSADGKEQVCP